MGELRWERFALCADGQGRDGIYLSYATLGRVLRLGRGVSSCDFGVRAGNSQAEAGGKGSELRGAFDLWSSAPNGGWNVYAGCATHVRELLSF